MKLCINGQLRDFPEFDSSSTLAMLVGQLQMKADRIAVERNGEIAPRATWDQITLADEDKLEIVQFVGGGR